MSSATFRRTLGAALTIIAGATCSESTAPGAGDCPAVTSSVQATVTIGAAVTFDWSPKCAMAVLLVESSGSDRWVVLGTNLSDDMPTMESNTMAPPVTYGQVPSGGTLENGPDALIVGQNYDLVLWRVLPAGTVATCIQKFEDACLVAVKSFTR